MKAAPGSAASLLQVIDGGDPRAAGELWPLVYDELRALARAQVAQLKPGQTLQATALVHEAFLRLLGKPRSQFQSTRHFFFAAARAMHDIVVESARAKATLKRGSQRKRIDLRNLQLARDAPSQEMLALSEALRALERHDVRKHQVVLLRFFAGCTSQQTAQAMNISLSTVERDWRYARAWLHAQMSDECPDEGAGNDGRS